jgi:hypothetical protein
LVFIDIRRGIFGLMEVRMSGLSFRTSRPDSWVQPRPYSDPSSRFRKYGPIRPMEEPGLLSRLFGLR